jgi:hypothetical protein
VCTRSDADEVVPGVEPVVVFPVTFSPVGTFIFIMPRIRRATNTLPNATPKIAAAIKYPVELSGFVDIGYCCWCSWWRLRMLMLMLMVVVLLDHAELT